MLFEIARKWPPTLPTAERMTIKDAQYSTSHHACSKDRIGVAVLRRILMWYHYSCAIYWSIEQYFLCRFVRRELRT